MTGLSSEISMESSRSPSTLGQLCQGERSETGEPFKRNGLYRAFSLIQRLEFEKAKDFLLSAKRQNPQDGEIYYWLALVHRRLGELENSLDNFRKLIHLKPKSGGIFYFAETFYLANRYLEAIEVLDRYFQMAGEHCSHLHEAFQLYGNAFVHLGDYDGAEEAYNKAFLIQPDSGELLISYGILELKRRNFLNAKKKFQESIVIDKKNDRAWLGLSVAYRYLGDFDLAWGNLQRALDINVQNPLSQDLFVQWSVEQKDWLKICGFIKKLESLGFCSRKQKFLLAKIYFNVGKYNLAKKYLEESKSGEVDGENLLSIVKCLEIAEGTSKSERT